LKNEGRVEEILEINENETRDISVEEEKLEKEDEGAVHHFEFSNVLEHQEAEEKLPAYLYWKAQMDKS